MKLIVETAHSPLVDTVTEILHRRGPAEARLTLAIDPALPAEGFRLNDGPDGMRLSGGDARGLLYGAGKWLREPAWRGSSAPARPLRGIYFASHFHNFYHDAPVAEVEAYVEELALWGCNALAVWFDMHHYDGIADPDAQAMIARLRIVLGAAKRVGMATALTTLANEAYRNSPEALRADWRAGQNGYHHAPGGHYHVELCPAKPGAIELMLAWRREMLSAFADVGIDYVWLWPYDQGGCTCADCAPWGANGFLRIAEPYARLVRELLPTARTILSTWYFDHFTDGEWNGLYAAFATRPDWADFLMINPTDLHHIRDRGAPAGLPVLDFPEVSMRGANPWGGYGIQPLAAHLEAYHRQTGSLLAGGFPYSEGIYEDANKVLMLQWGWSPERSAEDILREYATGLVGPALAPRAAALIAQLERQLPIDARLYVGEQRVHPFSLWQFPPDTVYAIRYEAPNLADAETTEAEAAALDAALAPAARTAWRWRIIRLRAAIDAELKRTGGSPSDTLDAWFGELTDIYAAANAEVPVAPPSRAAFARLARSSREAF